jgi:hypothetical protein
MVAGKIPPARTSDESIMEREFARGWRFLCRVAAAFAVVVACLLVPASGTPTANAAMGGTHCVSPTTGIDLNELYGVSAEIVTPFCTQVDSGQPWTVGARWYVGQSFEIVPEGFESVYDTPTEDFLAKFVEVKYVVDPGTAQERTYVFSNEGNVVTRADGEFVRLSPITLGSLRPLPVGTHVVDDYWVFSALHCDGLGDVMFENCLPAGETLYESETFQVTPGHHA